MSHGKIWAGAALIAAMAGGTIAHADVRAGVEAWEAGDYARAIREWRPLAVAGDADAQFNLAQAYKLGRGVPQNIEESANWFRRAADQGHIQAEDNLGLVLYQLGRKGDAMPWLERAARRGEPRAQYVLAAELFNGTAVSRDWVRAYALMKRASDSGLERASAALVQMDQHIPLEQRRQGLELAQTLEQSEGQARLAAMTASAPPRPAPAPTVRSAPVPPSAAGTSYTPPPAPQPAPAPALRPTPPRVAAPVPAAVAPAASGRWRVQLGAFSQESGARSAWSGVAGRLGGATADYVRAGNVIRLQAGPYASRADAERACRSIAPRPCFAVSR